MSRASKPRKRYREREIRQPMMAHTRDSLALELRLAVEGLVLSPSVDGYNQLVLMTTTFRNAGLKIQALEDATDALTLICERFERVGKVGVSDDEAETLRAAVDSLDAELPKLSHNRFRAALMVTRADMELVRAEAAA